MPANTLNGVFLLLTLLGQMAFLSLVPILLFPNLVNLFLPYRGVVMLLAIVLATLFLFALFIDSTVFHLYRTHIDLQLLQMMISPERGEVFQFTTSEWVLAISALLFIIVVESGLSYFILRVCFKIF